MEMPAPPILFAESKKGSGPALPERFVTGSVLKLPPRNLRPITDTGRVEEPAEVIANIPVTSGGIDDGLEKSSLKNFDVC